MGYVFNIQRFSIHDGPGVRTTVFLSGCNLRCAWCHNPESFDPTSGKPYTPPEVMDIVLKDKIYYKDGGGVTFSGGEASVQYDFLIELMALAKANHLHICLETNGIIPTTKLENLCQYVDIFLLDYKHHNGASHKAYTGSNNQPVIQTLNTLQQRNKKIILRCPIIPTINDTSAHFDAIKNLYAQYSAITKVEVMPYHNLGVQKWATAGLDYSLPHIPTPTTHQITHWRAALEAERSPGQ